MYDFTKGFFREFNLSVLSISTIRVTDIIDIMIVAFCIYQIMMWIRETRAWSLFKGVVVFFIIAASSYLFKLYTISLVVNKTLDWGIIVIAVLFQPELRKALEQMGKGRIQLSLFANSEQDSNSLSSKSVQEIVVAAKKMSEAKTGALIVIEKDVALGDHEQTGITIDALVSSQLLINIFENKTPLHDGAVLIRNNRVAAATCILPLTQSEIGKELGTRHRAAVGASEVSDANVLVVSEETGEISIARGGKLYKNLPEKKIKEMLLVHVNKDKKKRSLWKGRQADEKNT